MKFTQQIITSKLKNFSIPNGQCGDKAFDIATILFNKTVSSSSEKRYNSLNDVLCEISKALKNDKIVIIWLETGPMDLQNPKYLGIHCYFVFDDNPLQSFAIWGTPGAKFYDDAYTGKKIVDTINFFQNEGGVALHVVP